MHASSKIEQIGWGLIRILLSVHIKANRTKVRVGNQLTTQADTGLGIILG